MAVIEELSSAWEPNKHKDRYRARLQQVVERKRRGEKIRAPEVTETQSAVPDLMAALERTLEQLNRGSGGPQPNTRERRNSN